MKIIDLDPAITYAVNVRGRTQRAAVLFAARWETVRAHRNGEYQLVGYRPSTPPHSQVGARNGVPVLLSHGDPDPLAIAPEVREQMLAGGRPDHIAHVELVSPAVILTPWDEYEQRQRAREAAAERAHQERLAEQAAQDEARTRVLVAAGPDAWRLLSPPTRWTEFEALAKAYAAGRVSS